MKTRTYPALANGQPAISCFALSQAEYSRRQDAAHQRAERLAQSEQVAPHLLGRTQLWHAECPLGLKLAVCDEPLFCLTALLPSALLGMNDGQPLDFWDYAYVADVLRDWLWGSTTRASEVPSLRRALAWVEQKGSVHRDYSTEL